MRVAAIVFAVFAAGLLSGCGLGSDDAKPDPNQYLTPIAEAQAAGLTPYWLGPTIETTRGELRAVEGRFPQGSSGVALTGIQLSYFNSDLFIAGVDVRTFSKGDWSTIAEKARYVGAASVTRRNVPVAGRTGELIVVPNGTRPVNGYTIVVDAGDEVVVIVTDALGTGGTPGAADLNPLIDEQAFLQVVQNLRPYPQ